MARLPERDRLPLEPTSATSSSDSDPDLIRALEYFLEAAEAGHPPDRAAYLDEHPEIASRLASCLEGMDAIRGLDCPPESTPLDLGPGDPVEVPEPPTPPILLGDYLLLREVGRGGMGIVYEAHQQSLDRRVAVKVLPFASTLDPRQLQRFRTEAQAAAWLQHDHIVPVFASGSERGIQFYAMRLIEGRSLSALIERWRRAEATAGPDRGSVPGHASGLESPAVLLGPAQGRPFHRAIASLGCQAAEALEHAHRQGVLHRDIKPANLLVEDDGHLWLTDFGLARIQDREALTRSGDLLGTLRYMSPEQALGHHSVVDHRSDVYSLGATLYELLTLTPLFEGNEPQDLVSRILHEPPRPPRTIDPRIPRDLETIILKALAKQPGERYASAEEMADDLRRFRDDRPIRGRRPTPGERLTRWARRHQSAVLTAAVVMGLALLGQSASIMMLALEGRRSAEHALRASETGLRLYDTADALYQKIAEQLGTGPAESDAHRQLLETALGVYEQFALEAEGDSRLAPRVASALRKAGDIHLRLGHHSEAALCYGRALDRLDSGRDAAGNHHERGDELAHVLNRLGRIELTTGDARRGYRSLSRAVEVQEAWVADRGGDDAQLALIHYLIDLGRFSIPDGRSHHPDRVLEKALSLADALANRPADSDRPPATLEEAEALKRLIRGRMDREDRKYADAIAHYRSALELYLGLARTYPERSEFRGRGSEAALQLAWLLATCPEPSVHDEGEAVRLVSQSVRDDPSNADLLAHASVFFMLVDRHEDAERTLRAALASSIDRADLYNNLAWLLATCPDPRRRDPSEAIRLAEEAIKREPGVGIYWNTLGIANYRAGRLKEALASLDTSMGLSGGGDGFDWFVLAMALWKLGDRETASALYDRAVDWMELLPGRDPTLRRFREEADSTFEACLQA